MVAAGAPVFHFPYNPGGNFFGKSELKDLIPAQNALNKSDLTGWRRLTWRRLTGPRYRAGRLQKT